MCWGSVGVAAIWVFIFRIEFSSSVLRPVMSPALFTSDIRLLTPWVFISKIMVANSCGDAPRKPEA